MNTSVALITQTMRAVNCAAFLQQIPSENAITIVTSDTGGFLGLDFPRRAHFHTGSSPHRDAYKTPPKGVRNFVIRWARGGSNSGMKFDRYMRAITTRAPWLNRIGINRARRNQERLLDVLQTHLREQLAEIRLGQPISEIFVFDLFDLPTALEFGEANGIPVRVV